MLGAEGLSEAHLVQVDRQVVTPVAWCDSPLSIGRVTRLSVASENGYVGMLGAHAEAGPISTPIGDLLLDPTSAFAIAQTLTSTQRFDLYLPVPNNPLLVGVTFAVQGAGATVTAPFLLGSAMAFRIN